MLYIVLQELILYHSVPSQSKRQKLLKATALKVHIFRLAERKITGKYVAQITQNGNLAQLKGGNTFKVSDKIKRGDFKLTKILQK